MTDVVEHTVKKFTPSGVLVSRLGTPDVAGSSIDPVQFGNVADVAVCVCVGW